jgi:carbon starvation protein
MSLTLLALGVLAILIVGYFTYGRFIARQYNLDDARTTPAVAKNDGVDFVPEKPFYLLSQHFSAIAAAGPIAGPILACTAFGWGPCVLWILLGVIFIGAVHDFSALVASVRHGAHSIAEIAKQNLGKRAGLALLWFIWLALLYVIIAFTQITADSFVGKNEEFEGLATTFNKGGAVAMSSTLYMLLALLLGVIQRFLKPPVWLVTLIFVPATFACVWAGTKFDDVLSFGAGTWVAVILGYCLITSMLPMWLLQQPRGFLGGFVLYVAIAVGVAGRQRLQPAQPVAHTARRCRCAGPYHVHLPLPLCHHRVRRMQRLPRPHLWRHHQSSGLEGKSLHASRLWCHAA